MNEPQPAPVTWGECFRRELDARVMVLILLGGFLGTFARGLLTLAGALWPAPGFVFDWWLWLVNLAGAFALGVLTGASGRLPASRPFFTTGFLGAFTTYSSFALAAWVPGNPLGLRAAAALAMAGAGVGLAALGMRVGARYCRKEGVQ